MPDKSRTAIVTGAARRVGDAIVRALLDDGWVVLAHVHDDADAVANGATKVVADLAETDCADRIFGATATLPPVGLLVNNAARFAWDGFGDFKADEFDAHMAVNARAPAQLIDRLGRHDRVAEDASVINILDSKLASPNPDFLSYTLSKQALAGLTDLAARRLASQGIRVNAIAPALMLRSPGQTEQNFEQMHARNPLERPVTPADLIDAVRFLADARTVTGQILVLDSGARFLNLARDVQFLEPQ